MMFNVPIEQDAGIESQPNPVYRRLSIFNRYIRQDLQDFPYLDRMLHQGALYPGRRYPQAVFPLEAHARPLADGVQ